MATTGDTQSGSSAPQLTLSRVQYAVAAVIALYLTGSLLLWLWLLGDGANGTFRSLAWVGIASPAAPDSVNLVKLAYFTAVGGAVGGITFGMMNLQRHTTSGSFKTVFLGDYLFRPFGAAALALVVLSLARGGVLTILGADPTSGVDTLASRLAGLGIGFLVGFASLHVVKFLTGLAGQAFGPKSLG